MYLCIRTGMCISGATAVATEILGRIKYLFSMCCVFKKKYVFILEIEPLVQRTTLKGLHK